MWCVHLRTLKDHRVGLYGTETEPYLTMRLLHEVERKAIAAGILTGNASSYFILCCLIVTLLCFMYNAPTCDVNSPKLELGSMLMVGCK